MKSTAGNLPKIGQGTVKNALLPVTSEDKQLDLESSFQNLNSKLLQHAGRKAALEDIFRTPLHELMIPNTHVQTVTVK